MQFLLQPPTRRRRRYNKTCAAAPTPQFGLFFPFDGNCEFSWCSDLNETGRLNCAAPGHHPCSDNDVKWILLSCPLWFNSIGIVQGAQQSVVVVRILLMSCPVSTELCIPVADFCCGRCRCPSGLWSWTVCCCGGQWFANSWINLYSFEFLSVTILISVFFVGGEFVYLTFGTHSHWLTIYNNWRTSVRWIIYLWIWGTSKCGSKWCGGWLMEN